jgi:hypothetical protein
MLRPTVSRPLSWNKGPIWGLRPDFYYWQDICTFVDEGRSLTRGRVCRSKFLLALASAVFLGQFFPELTEEDSMAGFSKTQLLPILHLCLCSLCPVSSGTELSAVVFGQNIHLILILIIFSSRVFRRTVYTSNNRTEDLKENIRREIANIPAERLQRVNQYVFLRCEECLRVEVQHFLHLLWSVNCNYFIRNVTGQQAY